MQPYFMPYIGYFQLIANTDLFIVYDNIKYTKRGWINRNRILRDGKDVILSLPLKTASDSLFVADRRLATDFDPHKLLSQIKNAYRRAPFFRDIFCLLEDILLFNDHNLFQFTVNSITKICNHLSITTRIRVSSTFAIDHSLRAQDKILALCDETHAQVYVNPIGGLDLYSKLAFAERGVELRFMRSIPFEYQQFKAPFVPWLSIIDVMMFNSSETIGAILQSGWKYE